tara:strand:+ start:48 stop:230 length:183 start_codon:yes stop_codon:yes gene_type:complete
MTRRKEVSELDETEEHSHPDDEQRKTEKWTRKRKEKSRDQVRKAQRKRKRDRYVDMWENK